MSAGRELLALADGSLTCLDPETGELFHNRAGAYTEAMLNYVEPASPRQILARYGKISVLDVCFGLGYNTYALVDHLGDMIGPGRPLSVLALEADPTLLQLSGRILADERLGRACRLLDQGRWQELDGSPCLCPGTGASIRLVPGDLRATLPALAGPFDLIFHDPFSPAKCPELWTADIFQIYMRLLDPVVGRLVTYSSAAAVRGALRDLGFQILRTRAVGGKTGGTLALVPGADVDRRVSFPLSMEERRRLNSPSGTPYRDRSLSAGRAEILRERAGEIARRRAV